MELKSRAKRNRIAKYMDSFPEEFETIEDNLLAENPEIKLQTKSRIITLSCDDKGNVMESFRMRRGAGSKEEFLVKQEAYTALQKYYNDYYTAVKIKQSSFDESFIKLELETKIITLIYNTSTSSIEEKERARRGTKQTESQTISSKPVGIDSNQTTLDQFYDTEYVGAKSEDEKIDLSEKVYMKIPEGAIVRNNYTKVDYKVVKASENNIVEVFNKEHGYLTFARSDIEVMVNITG